MEEHHEHPNECARTQLGAEEAAPGVQLCAEGADFVRAGRVAAGALSDDSSLYLHLEELNLYIARYSMRVNTRRGEMGTPEVKDPSGVPQETVGGAWQETQGPPRCGLGKRAGEVRAGGQGTLVRGGCRVRAGCRAGPATMQSPRLCAASYVGTSQDDEQSRHTYSHE